jgi:hypothetical protein
MAKTSDCNNVDGKVKYYTTVECVLSQKTSISLTGLLQTWDRYMYIYRFTSDVGQIHVHLQVYFRLGTGCTCPKSEVNLEMYMYLSHVSEVNL